MDQKDLTSNPSPTTSEDNESYVVDDRPSFVIDNASK